MNNTIFLIMYAYYSDWQIYGYFTTRDEAEKYVVSHPSEKLDIYEIGCLDNQADLSGVSVKYEFSVLFYKNDSEWAYRIDENFDIYQS
ncbi:MAG: hypothetical protein J5965_07995, partial [Aeriscardovia sp.]|nr:hypothetical protein [Aeriscardovia sp.]